VSGTGVGQPTGGAFPVHHRGRVIGQHPDERRTASVGVYPVRQEHTSRVVYCGPPPGSEQTRTLTDRAVSRTSRPSGSALRSSVAASSGRAAAPYDPGGRGTARAPDPVSVTAVLFDVDDHVVAQRWYTHRRQLGEHPARFGGPGQVP